MSAPGEEPSGAPFTAVVELSFTPLPEHVRTARLVAVSVGRRVGFDSERLDEVRLAVGEACGRAVRVLQASTDPSGPVPVRVLLDDRDGLLVRVQGPHVGLPDDSAPDGGGAPISSDDDLALAVVRGLAPRLTTDRDALTLHWPGH